MQWKKGDQDLDVVVMDFAMDELWGGELTVSLTLRQ